MRLLALLAITAPLCAADFTYSYVLQPDGNQTVLADGATVAFPAVSTGGSVTATVYLTNRGTTASTVNAVALNGDAFRLAGLPLLPATVAAGNTFQFNVVFTPPQNQSYQGSLQVTANGAAHLFGLAGQGTAAAYSYEVTRDGTGAPVLPNGTIAFGETPTGTPLPLTVTVRNTGNAAGSVGSVTVVGSGFTASNLVPLPAALAAGASLSFTLTFNPGTPGPAAGRLVIDGATFNLSGTGTGAQLTLTFTAGGVTAPLAANGTANFPNVAAGASVAGSIGIENTGNVAASISNVSVTGRYFAVSAPALPARIDPGAAIALAVTFTPNALGVLTATLGIDTITVTLRGIGAAPPDLPAYRFTGAGDTAQPAEQPAIGLTLDTAYGSDITGTLRLSFTPESFASDPAIQFASGGTSAAFRIPAGSTIALFGTGATSVQFQSGTVAGTITFTPEFLTGEVAITPLGPPVKTVQIAAAAPVLRTVQIGTRTASSFEVLISGYSTARSVTQINLQFTGAAGANLQTTTLPLNAESAFNTWYQSSASQAVGSQFTASVTILVNGSISAIQSLSVTASNAKGTSNSSNSVALQ